VIGTTSDTVIRSSPSMKLTRFTNQTPASRMTARSSASGRAGAIRNPSGAMNTIAATAPACSTSRSNTGSDMMSSANPTSAIKTLAATSAGGIVAFVHGARSDATRSVAAITAIPAPCGVGMRCEERAFGLANA
jgi:hypothetical protein